MSSPPFQAQPTSVFPRSGHRSRKRRRRRRRCRGRGRREFFPPYLGYRPLPLILHFIEKKLPPFTNEKKIIVVLSQIATVFHEMGSHHRQVVILVPDDKLNFFDILRKKLARTKTVQLFICDQWCPPWLMPVSSKSDQIVKKITSKHSLKNLYLFKPNLT